MRGKVVHKALILLRRGITPACAGKSQSPRGLRPHSGDHPRVCGEKTLMRLVLFAVLGSPPRMRGKDGVNDSAQAVTGITPACAGKSSWHLQTGCFPEDHPRVCGEKQIFLGGSEPGTGSPPRVRGKGILGAVNKAYIGITPACAGKSARWQAGPPGPAPPPQMRLGWSPPPCTGRQCRTRKSTHARRARIPVPAHTPAPQ